MNQEDEAINNKKSNLKSKSMFLERVRQGASRVVYSSARAFRRRTRDPSPPYTCSIDVPTSPGSDDKFFFDASEEITSEELSVTIYKDVVKQNLVDHMKSSGGHTHILDDIEQGLFSADNLEGKSQVEKNIAFLWAALLKRHDLLPVFLDSGAELQCYELNGFSALHLSSLSGDVHACSFLISKGADVDFLVGKYTALHLAAFGNSNEVTQLLLKHGAQIIHAEDSDTPIHSAVKANAVECLQLLTDVAQDVNCLEPTGISPLHIAADLGQLQCLKILLSCQGVDVNAKTRGRESTPLHLAAENGYNECVAVLLLRGAKSDVRNNCGQTALHLAAKAQCVECVETLLSARDCNVNARDKDNRTPLHAAVGTDSQSEEVVDVLVRRRADVNAKDNYGCTPLHIAALNGLSICVETLFRHGADVTSKTHVGITALSIITRKIPSCIGMIYKKLDESILIHDPEVSHKEVKLKLDFRQILQHSKDGEIGYLQTFVDEGHKEILQHPLSKAFLHLKWRKIRKLYAFRLILCFLFVLCFTVYAFSIAHVCFKSSPNNLAHNDQNSTNITVGNVSNVSHTTHLPSNRSLSELCSNDQQVSKIWTYYVIDPHVVEAEYIILLLFTVYETVRQIFSMCGYSPFRHYFHQIDNILEWFVIISVFAVAVYTVPIYSWQKNLAAVAVLMGWLNLMFKVGQLPFFGPYVPMFLKVLQEFSKLFLAYCFLLIGFTVCLCIVMPSSDEFTYPHVGFIKILVMMTGELNLINFLTVEQQNTNVMFLLLFIAFILLVTIVMMNLLVGIAVHDIQGLQKTAGLSKLERQIRLISNIERAIFGIKSHPLPKSLLKSLQEAALVSPSAYRVVLQVKPFSPREKQLPKDILKEAFKIARNKSRAKVRRDEKPNLCGGKCANKGNGNSSFLQLQDVKRLISDVETGDQNIKDLKIEVEELKNVVLRLLESIEVKGNEDTKENGVTDEEVQQSANEENDGDVGLGSRD